ncbi:enoyl-CoA hydratase [Pseudooceanicola batsensis HTCC2597]|uniref:Enoyl-CoA hydratase n=2 Tax=Pseudooceanicola batsensis TaxID=314255 RepID=A3TT34_PSEBH|nr:enoyl-CoA hydratase [Pseudooceanicola batsensis HTCC2597]
MTQEKPMQSYDHYKTIKCERDGRIMTVTFNRPDQLNATDAVLHREASRIFTDLSYDDDVDVIVLTGAGKAFSAGGDVNWMQDGIDEPTRFERTAREARDIVFSMLDMEKPVICMMNGHAIGLGATIALLCDIIIASDRAKVGDPHVLMGLVAGDGGAVLWPQNVGYAKAKYYLMTGDLMTAEEAERIGLITKVVPADQLEAEAYGLAKRIASGPLKAISWTKISVNLQLKAAMHASFDAGIAYETVSNVSFDHQEAVNAFRDKREPQFTGR